ncbi:MAG: hypothetical protein ACPGN3_17425 [Opitutales bacterium]
MKHPRKKKNSQMMAALVVGAVLNVLLLLILGGMTVYKFVQPEEVSFEAPPALKPIEPPQVKYNQNKTKDRQDKTNRPKQKPIQVKTVANIKTPNVQIDLNNLAPSVNVAETVGSGLGNGLGSGGMRMGVSAVDFFGIKSKGERVVIILDAARSMLEPARGDIPGYAEVKEKLTEVVENLNSATLFNVMVFQKGLDVMSSNLVIANQENKDRALKFIDPYWKASGGMFAPDYKTTTFLNNYKPKYSQITPTKGSSRMDMALVASFEQGADAIFVITDGTPNFTRNHFGRDLEKYKKELAAFEKRKAAVTPAEIAKFEAEKAKKQAIKAKAVAEAREKRKQEKEREAKKRAEQGLAAVVKEGGNGLGVSLGVRPPWGHPPRKDVRVGPSKEYVDFIKTEAKAIYSQKNQDLPTVNIVGYSIPKKGPIADFLNNLKRAFPKSHFRYFGKHQGA